MWKTLLLRLASPVHALPVDLFRIAAALVVFGYLLRLGFEAPLFHAGDGVLDHEIIRTVFWFTWQPLFHERYPIWLMQSTLALAALLSLGILTGWRPRTCALGAYAIIVCSIRHNFVIVSVDDVIVHLLLFWLILLPTGTTLSFASRGKAWRAQQVPGATVRLFTGNIALIYFVAGISKWTSGMWLDGSALYAIMAVRPGWFSTMITLDWFPALRVMNYIALIIEPFLALVPFLPTGQAFKKFLGLLLLGLHLFIIATLDVVFANLGCMAALFLLFRNELMQHLGTSSTLARTGCWRKIDSFAAIVLVFILGAMVCSLTQRNWRKPTRENQLANEKRDLPAMAGGAEQLFFFGGLWTVGLIQQYRLLDWIDDRNFVAAFEITEHRSPGNARSIHEYRLVPPGMRSSLTLSYVLGATWLPISPEYMPGLRKGILEGWARRYAKNAIRNCSVTVNVSRYRVNPYATYDLPPPVNLMRFRCVDGSADIQYLNLEL